MLDAEIIEETKEYHAGVALFKLDGPRPARPENAVIGMDVIRNPGEKALLIYMGYEAASWAEYKRQHPDETPAQKRQRKRTAKLLAKKNRATALKGWETRRRKQA